MKAGDEAFEKRWVVNTRARRKEVGRRLAFARRDAQLSQEVVADTLGYDQADISRIEAGSRLLDVVELENFAVLYGKSLEYFETWKWELARTSKGDERQVLSADEFRTRASQAKLKRGRRWKRYKESRLRQ